MPTSPYHTADGKRVPSVSTIKGAADFGKSGALMWWASDLGAQGIDARTVRDNAADTGTLAHAICTSHYGAEPPDYDAYTAEQIGEAESAAEAFFLWIMEHDLRPTLVEQPLISEALRYGGTPDIYGTLDGVPTLIDLKTSKTIYERADAKKPRLKLDYAIQMGGYSILLKESGRPVEQIVVLGIPKTDDTPISVYTVENITACEAMFMWCLDGHALKRSAK